MTKRRKTKKSKNHKRGKLTLPDHLKHHDVKTLNEETLGELETEHEIHNNLMEWYEGEQRRERIRQDERRRRTRRLKKRLKNTLTLKPFRKGVKSLYKRLKKSVRIR